MTSSWNALADPARRRILTRLAGGERAAGDLAEGLGISQPAVSRHLRVLREAGLVAVRGEAQRRIYTLDRGGLSEIESFLAVLDPRLRHGLDALHTEIARGAAHRRSAPSRTENTA